MGYISHGQMNLFQETSGLGTAAAQQKSSRIKVDSVTYSGRVDSQRIGGDVQEAGQHRAKCVMG